MTSAWDVGMLNGGWPTHEEQQRDTRDHHGGGQELTRTERTKHEAELGVGLPRELERAPDDPVSYEKGATKKPATTPSARHRPALEPSQNATQQTPLAACFT